MFHGIAYYTQIYDIKRYSLKNITIDNQPLSVILFVLLLVQSDFKLFLIRLIIHNSTILFLLSSTSHRRGLLC
jgi:hypothetical protein